MSPPTPGKGKAATSVPDAKAQAKHAKLVIKSAALDLKLAGTLEVREDVLRFVKAAIDKLETLL